MILGVLGSLLGNRISGTIIFMLLGMAATAGYNWYTHLEEKLQYKAAMKTYIKAYDDLKDVQTANDKLLADRELKRREKEKQTNDYKEQLRIIMRKDDRWGNVAVPFPYADRLQHIIKPDRGRTGTDDSKKQSTAQRIIDRLRKAIAQEDRRE